MQTNLADFVRDTPVGREADAILRKCVHCGFCNATCPTYQLLGDELDGPRGRIYLIKQVLEGGAVSEKTQLHLDRCLTCRACETTCPSGVQYGHLVDIGRKVVEQRVRRSALSRFKRHALAFILPRTGVFSALLTAARAVRSALPASLREKVPPRPKAPGAWPAARHARRMLVLAGCVQPAIAPVINAAAARVLDRLGISLIQAPGAGCCGAVRFHLNEHERALEDMRALIDAWWPYVDDGAEAIVMTASGCGVTVKDYARLLETDPAYRAKAHRISMITKDLAEILAAEAAALDGLVRMNSGGGRGKVAFQSPCTLQHGQRICGTVEALLERAGFELTSVADAHLCCGSAGTYSLLQPELSRRLRANKLAALESGNPGAIVTANIGCLTHLQSGTRTSVLHWIQLLEQTLDTP